MTCARDLPSLPSVAERDVDLLLLEEFHTSPDFRGWFLGRVFGHGRAWGGFVGAWKSVTDPLLGESDLVLLVEDDRGGPAAVLIENKIGAEAQPNQARRYRARGNAGVASGNWRVFRTCIVGPAEYPTTTADAAGYDERVSYEDVREWFRRGGADPRAAYRAGLLDAAIAQQRRGYPRARTPT